MEMVKTYPQLSPFQQVLLRGLHEGVLVEEDMRRVKAEGASLTLSTAERFFRASARKESYQYAVRLMDSVLSYYLTSHASDAVQEVKQESLAGILRKGVLELRKLNQLPTTSLLPREKADSDIVELLVEKAKKLRLSAQFVLELLMREIKQRKENDQSVALAEFFILRIGGKLYDFRSELCHDICLAQFLATIYNLTVGPYLTRDLLKQVARRKRPSLEEAGSKLRAFQAELPPELQVFYRDLSTGFLSSSDAKAFFGKKAPISVFTDYPGSVYYAERSAERLDQPADE